MKRKALVACCLLLIGCGLSVTWRNEIAPEPPGPPLRGLDVFREHVGDGGVMNERGSASDAIVAAELPALTHPYLLALQAAYDETGQHPGLLACVGWLESKGVDAAIGALGERGVVQLHPLGELPEFYRRGYTDPSDPAQAFTYLGQRLNEGGGSAWATWRGCR